MRKCGLACLSFLGCVLTFTRSYVCTAGPRLSWGRTPHLEMLAWL